MRSKSGAARNQAKKRLFKAVKGFVGGRRRLLRTAKETLLRAGMFAFRDRRTKKRDFRRLWIIRLSAAAEMRGLRYSQFINGLRLANVRLDRKSLSELAIHDPETFDAVTARVRDALEQAAAALRQRQAAPPAPRDGPASPALSALRGGALPPPPPPPPGGGGGCGGWRRHARPRPDA